MLKFVFIIPSFLDGQELEYPDAKTALYETIDSVDDLVTNSRLFKCGHCATHVIIFPRADNTTAIAWGQIRNLFVIFQINLALCILCFARVIPPFLDEQELERLEMKAALYEKLGSGEDLERAEEIIQGLVRRSADQWSYYVSLLDLIDRRNGRLFA